MRECALVCVPALVCPCRPVCVPVLVPPAGFLYEAATDLSESVCGMYRHAPRGLYHHSEHMCSEYPKHPRSCPGSTLDPNAARIRSHTFSATAHRCKSHTRTSDAPVPDSGQDAHHAAHHRAQLRKSAPELPEITGWLHRAGKIERWTCCTRLSNRRCIARATRARRALFRSTRRGSRAACCTSLYATMHARIQTAQIAGCSNRTGVRELEGAHVVLEKSLVDEAKHKTTYEQEGSGHFAGEWRQL